VDKKQVFFVSKSKMIFDRKCWIYQKLILSFFISQKLFLYINQGILPEGERSVQFTSLYQLVQISAFYTKATLFFFMKTTYLNVEVNCTESSPLVRVPCVSRCIEGEHTPQSF